MKKHRATYLQISDWNLLNEWAILVNRAFRKDSYGTFLVGSCLEGPDFRDVDVRVMLKDDAFDALFPGHIDDYHPTPKNRYMNLAFSLWAQKVTGLPVDFQFQKTSEANEQYPNHRNSIGHIL